MSDQAGRMPQKLQQTLDLFATITDRQERIQTLIEIAKGYKEVPAEIAERPFAAEHRVPHCESDAYVWGEPQADGTLKFHFAVENPQGIAARAGAVILGRGLNGAPPEEVVTVPPDIMYDIFGRELSMGKNMGLTSMVNMVRSIAAREIAKQSGSPE